MTERYYILHREPGAKHDDVSPEYTEVEAVAAAENLRNVERIIKQDMKIRLVKELEE